MTAYGGYRRATTSKCDAICYLSSIIFFALIMLVVRSNADFDIDTVFIGLVATGMFLIFINSVIRAFVPRCS